MSENNLVPATWPESDCEFYQHPHAMRDLEYHLAFECETPHRCDFKVLIDAHHVAQNARGALAGLWCSRLGWPTP